MQRNQVQLPAKPVRRDPCRERPSVAPSRWLCPSESLSKEAANVRYRNAGDLLPEALVKELQRYVQGEYLYIPTDGTQRKGWGERSGARQMLDARNQAIRQAFRQGVSPEVLGEQYHLSPASIRRIVYSK